MRLRYIPRHYENKNESEAVLTVFSRAQKHTGTLVGLLVGSVGLASTPTPSPGRLNNLILLVPPSLCAKTPSDIK